MDKQAFLVANRYQLLEILGQGGMGTVYRALDHLTRQTVALKRVNAIVDKFSLVPNSTSGDIRLALALEFRTLAGLRHPNIISVLDYGFDALGLPFFTMEMLTEPQPIDVAARDKPLETQVRLLNEMLLALSYLHRRGIIHHDLKPTNVLVTPDGGVKVLDFGLASELTTELTTDVTRQSAKDNKLGATGTVSYMAPELLIHPDAPATVQSDLYAVGVIAYEILLGRYPFVLAGLTALLKDILLQAPDTAALETPVALWLDRLLAKAPELRPANVDQVIQDLSTATSQPLPPESLTIRESFLQASRFVGRDAELDALKTCLESILNEGEATAAFLLIGGESGVGKSRLVDELRSRALVRGAVVLQGQAVAGGGVPFQLWHNPARRLALSTRLSDLEAGILKDLVPDIGALLGRDVNAAPEITGSAWQERIIFTLVDLFKRQTQPIVLILEDLQWTIESRAVLKQLIQVRGQLARLLVIGTYRDDEQPDLPNEFPEMQLISLKRLKAEAIAELSESMLGEVGKQPEVVDLLQRETEGNVFFMVEVVRTLADDAGRLSAIGRITLPAHIFTGGVQKVIQQRLNRLPEAVQNWLKPVAVAGRRLDLAILDQLSMPQGTPQHTEFLPLCANAAVLEVVDGEWRFSHDKIRETLLADLSTEERTALHHRVAVALEAVYYEDERYHEVLLEHWHQAGNLDKEIHYLNPVADRLIEISADHQRARALLERGLQYLPDEDVRRVPLLNMAARSHWLQGDYNESQTLAQEALALAQQNGQQRGIASSLNNLGIVASRRGDYVAARDYYQRSLAIQWEIDDQFGIASSLNNLGIVAFDQRDYGVAQDYYQQALSIRQRIVDQQGIAACLNNLAIIANDQGDFAQAREYQQQSLAISQAIGSQLGIALSFASLGYTYVRLGEGPAQQAFYQALKILHAIQVVPLILVVMVGFAAIRLRAGDPARAGELAGLLASHPARHPDLLKLLDELVPVLKTVLSADDLEAAMERGKALDLDKVVRDLLVEFA